MTGGTTVNDWWYDQFATDGIFASQNRSWEILNIFKNLPATDFAITIVHDL